MGREPKLQEGTALVEAATEAISDIDTSIRPLTSDSVPGALLDLRSRDLEYYILGDLHANLHNLNSALVADGLEEKLSSGQACLVLLGDIVNDDRTGYLTEMGPSLILLEKVLRLLILYPERVFLIQGNHDTFDPLLVKSGIKQGLLFDQHVQRERGMEYRNALARFFDSLPLFVLNEKFLSAHAGPVRDGCDYGHLVEIRRYPEDARQLMWNRINQIGSLPNRKEYATQDIHIAKKLLGVKEDTYFVVGHNPLHDRGGEESVWFDIMGVKNHVIIYDALPEVCPILKFNKGTARKHELLFADLGLRKSRFILGDIY